MRVANNVHQLYRGLTDRCRMMLQGGFINNGRGWKGNPGYCSIDANSRSECRGYVGADRAMKILLKTHNYKEMHSVP